MSARSSSGADQAAVRRGSDPQRIGRSPAAARPTRVWRMMRGRDKLGDEVIGPAGSAIAPIDIGGCGELPVVGSWLQVEGPSGLAGDCQPAIPEYSRGPPCTTRQ